MLLFIYNVNAGAVSVMLDSAHKLLRPNTYTCRLCELTYGLFTENEQWKDFRENAAVDMLFLHKDEFLKQYKSKWLPKYTFPCVLIIDDNRLNPFISSDDFKRIETVDELISEILNRL